MRVLICGDRNWTAAEPIRVLLDLCPDDTVVIHGAARGADTIAGRLATERGLAVEPYPADWHKHGRAAGPVRNSLMLIKGKPDEVHAFHDHIEQSRGTRDMVTKARQAGVPVTVHTWSP